MTNISTERDSYFWNSILNDFKKPNFLDISNEIKENQINLIAKKIDPILINSIFDYGPEYIPAILNNIFSPFLTKMNKVDTGKKIISCDRDTFIRRYNINSDILTIFDEIIIELEKSNPGISENVVLFGGKVVDLISNINSNENDFDIWITNNITNFICPNSFKYLNSNYKYSEYEYKNSKIQIMTSLCIKGDIINDVTIENVLHVFDFRHCAVAVDSEKFHWIKGAVKDIKLKRSRVSNFVPSKTIMMRFMKYASRGFKFSLPDMILISIMQLSSIDIDSGTFEEKLFTRREYGSETLHALATQLYENI